MKPLTRLCSEERLLRARRGQLSSCEWHDLADHLAACADCRMDWRLVRDFDQSAAVRQGDEKLLASAMKVALATPKQRLRRLSRFAVAAAVLLTAGASASGAMLWHLHSAAPTVEPAPGKSGDGRPGAARSVVHAVVPPNDRETAQEPETAAPELPPTPPARALPRRARAARALASLQPSPSEVPDAGLAPLAARETAYGLLGQAMAERQQGRWQSAVLALRSLQREFRDSPEASVALVSLGNLLLDDDEAAEALPLFRQYCQQSPSGALVPEAMAGQARALERLQRTVEARALWLDLRRRFPGSVHARTQVIPERQMGAP